MIKTFSLLKRRSDQGKEEFRLWWLEKLAPYTAQLPGLRRYKVCLTNGSTTHPDSDPPFDGLAELWFDDQEALERSFASEVGKGVVAYALSGASLRWVLITEEHEIL